MKRFLVVALSVLVVMTACNVQVTTTPVGSPQLVAHLGRFYAAYDNGIGVYGMQAKPGRP